MITQKSISIIQENNFHTIGSNHINTVDAFNKREKATIETIKDSIIIYGLYLSSDSVVEAHKITGNKGKTQGARIVNTQAKNDTTSKVIINNKKIR